MELAARTGVWAGGGMPTAKDYVQDGLIAMWDGIENAGWGVHDPNAKEWKDLISGESVTHPSIAFTDKSLSMDGSYRIRKDKLFYANDGYSLELVFLAHTSPPSDSGVVVFGSFYGCGINWQRYWQPNIGSFYQAIGWPERIRFASMALRKDGHRMFTCNAVDYIEQDISSFEYPYLIASYVQIGGGWNQGGNFDGEIYSIRLYNKNITKSDVAANYAIDKARFNLP